MSRILSAIALALSLVSGAIADDPPGASLDFDVFGAMPSLVAASDSAPLDFDVFGAGKTVTVQEPLDFDVFGAMQPSRNPLQLKLVADTVRYPIRDRATWWSGCPQDKFSAIAHLSSGEHAGLFAASWLSTLSIEELQSLHSDHHDGCVDETKIKRAPLTAIKAKPVVPAPPVATYQYAPQQSCRTVWNGRQWVRLCR